MQLLLPAFLVPPPTFPRMQSAAFSHIAGQAVMFASLYAMRRQGVH